MAKKVTHLEVCDAPFCEVQHEEISGVLTVGYHIYEMKYVDQQSVTHLTDVYACSIDHVGPAISAKIDEIEVQRANRKKPKK